MAEAPFKAVIEASKTDRRYPIGPDDFDLDNADTLASTFGKSEVEATAERLIRFFQMRGYWCEFTIDELTRFYKLKDWDPNPMFFGLMGAWFDDGGMCGWGTPKETYLAVDVHGKYCVTDLFIIRCAKNLRKKAA
jgi:hypothetical protein